jgi:hypothetical protein
MLTLDDLEHFSDPSMAHLFAPSAGRTDADRVARLARIVACLNACRDVPTEELVEGALAQASFRLRTALRLHRRSRRPDPAALLAAVEAALVAVGQPGEQEEGPAEAERLEGEAEIQAVAAKCEAVDSLDPELLGALARGEFQILPSSDLAPLAEVVGKFGAKAQVDVDLALDRPGPTDFARVRLMVEGGLWRWAAQDGCCMSKNGQPAFFLPPADPVVQALLAGLALRNGRTALAWAEAA